MLPRPHHPNLDKIPAKHPTRAISAAIHYQLHKKMFTKFTASQTDVADLFQLQQKKFFMNVTGHEYDPSKKPTKAKKLKTSSQEGKSEQKTPAAKKEDHPTPTPEWIHRCTIGRCNPHYTKEKVKVQSPRFHNQTQTFPKEVTPFQKHFRCQNLNFKNIFFYYPAPPPPQTTNDVHVGINYQSKLLKTF